MDEINKPRENEPLRLYQSRHDAPGLFVRASRLDAREETRPLAEALYREVVRLQPDHVEALNNLGVLLHRRREYEGAMHAYGQALLVDPARAETHNNVGCMLQESQKLEAAAVYLARAVRLDPAMVEARVNLALTLQGLGKFRSALRHWGECLRLSPEGDHAELAKRHAARCREAV